MCKAHTAKIMQICVQKNLSIFSPRRKLEWVLTYVYKKKIWNICYTSQNEASVYLLHAKWTVVVNCTIYFRVAYVRVVAWDEGLATRDPGRPGQTTGPLLSPPPPPGESVGDPGRPGQTTGPLLSPSPPPGEKDLRPWLTWSNHRTTSLPSTTTRWEPPGLLRSPPIPSGLFRDYVYGVL